MKRLNLKRGFTLIELLVVIAIIGILSSVVLASLNTARAKGADAAAKAELANARAQAELNYDTFGCYSSAACNSTTPAVYASGACTSSTPGIWADANFDKLIQGAKTATGKLWSCSSSVAGTNWAFALQLKADTTGLTGWCVDSTGKSKQITIATNDQAGLNGEVSAGACVE